VSDAITKYAKLVDLLLEKTKAKKVAWTYDGGRDVISVWNGPVLLQVTQSSDENWEKTYSVALLNKSGDYLEFFNDDTLSGIDVDFGEDSYFERMRDLYLTAMRQVTGADRALDDFIAAVERDDLEIPF